MYPMVMILFGLLYFGHSCFNSRIMGIIVGSCVVALSSCSLSWPASKACRYFPSCGMFASI